MVLVTVGPDISLIKGTPFSIRILLSSRRHNLRGAIIALNVRT